MRDTQEGMSEVVGTILIIVLVIAVAVIMASQFLGFFNLLGKSAYIAPEVKVVNVSGVQAISLYSRGGDVASLNTSGQAAYELGLYVDTPESSDKVVYGPGLAYFGPGDTLYIYRTPAGYVATADLTGVTGTLPMPSGQLSLRLVDETAHILIANVGIGETGTGTGTATVTSTPTTCVVGSGWIIQNPESTQLSYELRNAQPGNHYLISSGVVPADTDLTIWYEGFPNNVELNWTGNTGNNPTIGLGTGNRWCRFANFPTSPSEANKIRVDHYINLNPPP
jgi:hypothetical protein